MNNKKKIHPILKILSIFFIIFIALYIASESGYYESKVRDKVTFTEESIKEFEIKIANGEAIDLDSYINNETPDYSNKMSRLGDNLTSSVAEFVSKSSKIVIDIFKSLF